MIHQEPAAIIPIALRSHRSPKMPIHWYSARIGRGRAGSRRIVSATDRKLPAISTASTAACQHAQREREKPPSNRLARRAASRHTLATTVLLARSRIRRKRTWAVGRSTFPRGPVSASIVAVYAALGVRLRGIPWRSPPVGHRLLGRGHQLPIGRYRSLAEVGHVAVVVGRADIAIREKALRGVSAYS